MHLWAFHYETFRYRHEQSVCLIITVSHGAVVQAALVEENGVNLYRERCKTLGIFPLSEVNAVLGREHADLTHCYMGAMGVHAFAHALACKHHHSGAHPADQRPH